jgi:hypothetical protein
MKENERLRHELCRTHETYTKQIKEKELIINELREQLNLIQSKANIPPLTSPTSTMDVDLSSPTGDGHSLKVGNRVYGSLQSIPSLPLQENEEEEEVLSDKRPTISRSLSKIKTSSLVRKLSTKKKHLLRRRRTPLPTTLEHVDAEDAEKEQQMNHETNAITGSSSSKPFLPMSPIRSRLERRLIISPGSRRVRELPREQSLSNISDDDTTATEDDDEAPVVLSKTMHVQNRKVVDALEREGRYTGTIDRQTELPDEYGR